MRSVFTKESFFSATRQDLFAFHERPDAFSLLTAPFKDIQTHSTVSTLQPSDEVARFTITFLFLKFHFEMQHTAYEPDELFVDEQKSGLFSHWKHSHRFRNGGFKNAPASLLQDHIEFSHPLLFLFLPFVKRRLSKMFEYRHKMTAQTLYEQSADKETYSQLKVVVTGATGLIGKRIVEILMEMGFKVVVLARNTQKARDLWGHRVEVAYWDFTRPEKGDFISHIQNADSLVHLAGTPLFKQRWTDKFIKEAEDSRVLSTRQLVQTIQDSAHKPKSFITASAIGIYGTDPERKVDEASEPSHDLLARICVNWENEARKLNDSGVRTAQIRIGIVLSKEAGALKEMLPLFYSGMGGVLGHPDHFINFIHLEDVARIFVAAILNPEIQGPCNATSPNPVRNQQFARAVSKVLHRPGFMRYPVSLLKVLIGPAAQFVSGGPRVTPEKLMNNGYEFFFDNIESALRNILER